MPYPSSGEPIDVQVMDALQSALEGIQSPAFHHDVAQVVKLKTGVLEGLTTPCIAILPVGRPQDIKLANVVVKRQMVALGLSLRIESEAGSEDPDDITYRELSWFLNDVGHALRTDHQLGELVWSVQIVNDQLYPRDGSSIAWAEAEALIHYHHRYEDPSAQC